MIALNEYEIPNIPMKNFEWENDQPKGKLELLQKYINKELNENVNNYIKSKEIDKISFFFSIYIYVLSKYSNQEKVYTSIINNGRNPKQYQKMKGMFESSLPLLINVSNETSFEDFIKENMNILLKLYKDDLVSFDELINQHNLKKLNNCFVYQPETILTSEKNEDDNDDSTDSNSTFSKFDITFNLIEKDSDYVIKIEFNSDLYETSTIEKFVESYEEVIRHISDFENLTNTIDYIPLNEKNKIIYEFNDNDYDYTRNKCYHTEFERVAQENPDNIAIIFNEKEITYRELDEMSNSLAHVLKQKGIERNDIIPIVCDRSYYFVVSALAIMKSGGAFLFVDPEFPIDRITYMIKEAHPKLILTYIQDNESFNTLNYLDIPIVQLDHHNYNENRTKIDNINDSSDLSYVMFTSGTTGKPKGTMITHDNLINHCLYVHKKNGKHDIYGDDLHCALSISKFTFALSVTEIFYTLLRNTKVVICNNDEYNDPYLISNLINKYHINFMCCVPSRFRNYLNVDEFRKGIRHLKYILFGGEKIDISTLKILKNETNIKIYNVYGLTETTVLCSIKYVDYSNAELNSNNENLKSIGKSLCNCKVYILDKYLKPVPIGVEGEIYIGGAGVGKGYLNRNELTHQKFMDSSSLNINNSHYQKIYSTGDLGKWNENGEIIYVGRRDFQVKINGQRIELSEIENTIKELGYIKDSVVIDMVNNNTGSKNLVCYFISEKDIKVERRDIKEFLNTKLPKSFIPSYYIPIKEIPINASGKLNRNLLPEPSNSDLIKEDIVYVPPKTKTEKIICRVYAKLFNIGENDLGVMNDFYDLGGDSLNAIKVKNELIHKFNIQLTLKDILQHSKICSLAELVDSKLKSNDNDSHLINHINYEISNTDSEDDNDDTYYTDDSNSSDKYIEFVVKDEDEQNLEFPIALIIGKSSSFKFKKFIGRNLNTLFYCKLKGDINTEKLENAANVILERHSMLRSVFIPKKVDGQNTSYGKIRNGIKIKIEHYTRDNFKKFVRPYDISKDLLIRIGLIEKSFLMIDMNHLISDGFSMVLFIKELFKVYNGEKLNYIPLQYGDFAREYNRIVETKDFTNELNYYKEIFKDVNGITCLPYKSSLKNRMKFLEKYKFYHTLDLGKRIIFGLQAIEKSVSFELNQSVFNSINRNAKRYNLSKTAYMLAIYSLVLSFYSGQNNIYSLLIDFNRKSLNANTVIGLLVSELPVAIKVDQNMRLIDFIIKCSDILLNLLDFNIPNYKVLNELNLPKSRHIFKYDPCEMNDSNDNKTYEITNLNKIYKHYNNNSNTKDSILAIVMDCLCMVQEMKDHYRIEIIYDSRLFDDLLFTNIRDMYYYILSDESLLYSNITDIQANYMSNHNNIME